MKRERTLSTWARRHVARACLLVLVGELAVASAAAQNNSLLGRPRTRRPAAPTTQPGPTSQPAAGQDAAPVPPRVRTTVEKDGEFVANETLLATSPIAVKKPKPTKVKVHDQVTIIVRESKSATTDSKYQSKRDWTHDWSLDNWIMLSTAGLVPAQFTNGNPKVGFQYKNDYKGDGKLDRKDELTTRVQATVIDVKPNGTLILEATKDIKIDEDGYKIRLTGSCRSDDVTPQNTVLSTQIAELKVDVDHQGAVRDASRRGWLVRLLDAVTPF